MTDLTYLAKLIDLLQSQSVAHFKSQDIELTFGVKSHTTIQPKVAETSGQLVDVPIDESKLPPDLRTDAITDYDKILNWSTNPDNDPTLPLTGDLELQ